MVGDALYPVGREGRADLFWCLDDGEDENDGEAGDGDGAVAFDMRRETEELLLRLAVATDQLRRLLVLMDQA